MQLHLLPLYRNEAKLQALLTITPTLFLQNDPNTHRVSPLVKCWQLFMIPWWCEDHETKKNNKTKNKHIHVDCVKPEQRSSTDSVPG